MGGVREEARVQMNSEQVSRLYIYIYIYIYIVQSELDGTVLPGEVCIHEDKLYKVIKEGGEINKLHPVNYFSKYALMWL